MPNDQDATERRQVGRHVVRFEPPDLIVAVPRGEVSREHVPEIAALVGRCGAGRPYLLLLADLSSFEGIGVGTRKAVARLGVPIPYRGMAMFGASFPRRLAVKLTVSALNLITGRDNPVRFCATEAEARAWIEERRRHLALERLAC